jgi:hypothetical protein
MWNNHRDQITESYDESTHQGLPPGDGVTACSWARGLGLAGLGLHDTSVTAHCPGVCVYACVVWCVQEEKFVINFFVEFEP